MQLMEKAAKTPIERIKEWWGVVLIAVGLIGGFIWLDKTYARIEKLEAEKCWLTYEIRLTQEKFKFETLDKELSLQRNEHEDLLIAGSAPQPRLAKKEELIKNLEERSTELGLTTACLDRARYACTRGDTQIDKCYKGE